MFPKSRPSNDDIDDGGGEGVIQMLTLADEGGWGVILMLTFADRGEGVKNCLKYADVILARSLSASFRFSFTFRINVRLTDFDKSVKEGSL